MAQSASPHPRIEYLVAAILTVSAVGANPQGTAVSFVTQRFGEVLRALRQSGHLAQPSPLRNRAKPSGASKSSTPLAAFS
jgi:hypothetical protein